MLVLEAVWFNHDKRSTRRSALNIRKNATNGVGKPEWRHNISENPEDSPAAYALNKLGRRVTIKASITSSEKILQSAEVRIKNCARRRVVHFRRKKTGFVTLELIGFVRRYPGIGIWDEEWHWEYRLRPRSPWKEFAISRHRIYTLLDVPTAPWRQRPTNSTNTQLPWTDILDYACRWAEGMHSAATAAAAITRRLYALGPSTLSYDCPGGGSSHYSAWNFEGTAFVDRLRGGIGNGYYVNCSDCATIVSTLANAVGANLWQSRMGWSFGLNDALAIGAAAWQTPCGWPSFNYHEVAWTGSCTERNRVYDACLEVNGGNDPTSPPRIPLLPQGLRFSKQNEIRYRERLVIPADRSRCDPQPSTRTRRFVV